MGAHENHPGLEGHLEPGDTYETRVLRKWLVGVKACLADAVEEGGSVRGLKVGLSKGAGAEFARLVLHRREKRALGAPAPLGTLDLVVDESIRNLDEFEGRFSGLSRSRHPRKVPRKKVATPAPVSLPRWSSVHDLDPESQALLALKREN